MKILIVDDLKEDLYLLETILKRSNYKVVTASNGAEALEKLRAKDKNLLTDRYSIKTIESGGFGGNPKYQKIVRCRVAEAYLFVRHDGFIDFPCKIHPIKRYNALKNSIYSIYNSKEARNIMKQHDNYDFCNKCRLGCAIASSIPTRWKTVYSKYIRGFLDGNLR